MTDSKRSGEPRGSDELPLSLAWITEDMITEAVDVWSEAYGRVIARDEAIEVLVNVRHFCEIMVAGQKRES